MNKILIFFVLLCCTLVHPKERYLIIHGTAGLIFHWHAPGGDFYESLVKAVGKESVLFFIWSGNITHQARMQGARELVAFINDYISKETDLTIIAHSHGANVAFLASQIMNDQGNNKNRISRFYALGAPINMSCYWPEMNVIKQLYNLFSFNDCIQPVAGWYERELPMHERVANLLVTIDGEEPLHSGLHSPVIARWLPHLSKQLDHRSDTFALFKYETPGIIHFNSDTPAIYEIDDHRKNRQMRDAWLLRHVNTVWTWKRQKIIERTIIFQQRAALA